MTSQEIFDKAVSGIREQGCRCVNDNGDRCLYRGPNGTKCAFGHLIPDEKYKTCFENKFAGTVIEIYFPEFSEHKELIGKLQRAHDSGPRKEMLNIEHLSRRSKEEQEELIEKAFEQVAKDFGLVYEKKEWKKI